MAIRTFASIHKPARKCWRNWPLVCFDQSFGRDSHAHHRLTSVPAHDKCFASTGVWRKVSLKRYGNYSVTVVSRPFIPFTKAFATMDLSIEWDETNLGHVDSQLASLLNCHTLLSSRPEYELCTRKPFDCFQKKTRLWSYQFNWVFSWADTNGNACGNVWGINVGDCTDWVKDLKRRCTVSWDRLVPCSETGRTKRLMKLQERHMLRDNGLILSPAVHCTRQNIHILNHWMQQDLRKLTMDSFEYETFYLQRYSLEMLHCNVFMPILTFWVLRKWALSYVKLGEFTTNQRSSLMIRLVLKLSIVQSEKRSYTSRYKEKWQHVSIVAGRNKTGFILRWAWQPYQWDSFFSF